MWGCVINWEIHDSFSIRNTREGSQSSFTCPLWLMHLLPVYNMCDHIARAHNIGSCIMYWGCLNMMMVKSAISISHPAKTTCFHFEWSGFEGAQSGSSESCLWLHLQAVTRHTEVTSLSYSLWCPAWLLQASEFNKQTTNKRWETFCQGTEFLTVASWNGAFLGSFLTNNLWRLCKYWLPFPGG